MKTGKKLLLFLALILVCVLLFSSIPASVGGNPGRGRLLAEARKALEQELLPLAGAGFVGISHSESDGEITVFVEDEQAKQKVPRSFEDYTVQTKITGKIQALSTQVAEPLAGSAERRGEVSPLVGGISLSAYVTKGEQLYLYAGTLGMVTYNDKILSNAHVIAMNPETAGFLPIGTTVVQPGTLDGGRPPDDRVGALEDYINIDFSPNAKNYADAAISSIDGTVTASPGEQFSEGDNYWIEGWTEVLPGNTVRKSGRTTGVTTGEVLHTNVSVVVQYGSKSAYFADQIVVEQYNWSFVSPGDSGSAVDKDGEFVGLVFAGSADCAVICKAEHIIDGLDIEVETPKNSLTISTTPGGSTTPPEGMHFYDPGTVVDLVAVPDTVNHYHFVEWTGDTGTIGDPYAASTNITMNGSYSIIANFELDPYYYSLTIASTSGGGVTQPGEGPFVYGNYTEVDLVAEPDDDNHYHFVEWTGNVSTIGNVTATATTITMNDSYSITANFALDDGWYSLTVSSTDGGEVTTPPEEISVHAANTTVDVVAVPDGDHQFLRWTGDVETIADIYGAATTIAMNASYSITAQFDSCHPEPMVILLISSAGGGSVTTPGEGTHLCPLGAEVNLVAEPAQDCQFIRWSGDVDTIANIYAASTTITMDRPYSIVAYFTGGGFCFIATAAYGTPMAEEIQILREFRDQYLLTNPVGRALVDTYYRVSPPIAEFITEHPSLKPIVRAGLLPAVAMSTLVVNTTSAQKAAIISLLALVSVAVAIWATRRRGQDPEHS